MDRRNQRLAHAAFGDVPRYATYGDAAAPALVLVPGLDGCASFYAEALPELARDFHVIVYHLPLVRGRGGSLTGLA